MARYTIDYSPPSPARRHVRESARLPLLLGLLGLCLGLMAFIYASVLRAENRYLRDQRDAALLRYDSLMAVQQERNRYRTRDEAKFPLQRQEQRPARQSDLPPP